MERQAEQYNNKLGEDKSAEQERFAAEALRRCTTDATLNGDGTVTKGPYPEIPFDASLQTAAGGMGAERLTSSLPSDFGAPVTPVPREGVSASGGRHMNGKDIFGS